MKQYVISIICLIIFSATYAQSPQAFQYQAVVRDMSGNVFVSQPVNFRLTIISGVLPGTVVYEETQSSSTNQYGIVTLEVGNGTPASALFSSIDWSVSPHFIKVETDLGSGYIDMGTTQLLSVPYALYSENSGNIPVYTGGSGIDVTGTTITNTSPDQALNLTQGGATTITGTYPNYTISSTDSNTVYSAGTGINVTANTISSTQNLAQTLSNGNSAGTSGILMNNNSVTEANIFGLNYDNASFINMYYGGISDYYGNRGLEGQVLTNHIMAPYTYVAWDNPLIGTVGTGLSLTGNTINSVWTQSGNHIFNNNVGNVGVGINNPVGKMVVKGDASALPTDPLFEVKNAAGQSVFVVYPDSVHVYVKDDGSKSNKGGFAVSGRNNAKALTHDFLYVNPDYTRVYTGDPAAGFGVENIGVSSDNSYMHLTPDNYFIGHQTGNSITTGMYNSFIGYQSGFSNTSGYKNCFLGFKSGYSNIDGYSNVFIGDSCGALNTSGYWNTACGYKAMVVSTTGWNNTAFGVFALYKNTSGNYNTGIGLDALYSNTTGQSNVAIGFNALLACNGGNNNTAIGTSAYSSGTFFNSTAIGASSVITANNQVVLGNGSITSLYCMGAYATTSANAANMVVLNTGQILRSTSSKRYKRDIHELTINTEDIYKLRPVSYISIMDDKPYFGLVAEEVAEVIPELAEFAVESQVVPESKSNKLIPDAVKYPMLSVLILSEVQKHNKKINELNSSIKKLETENYEMKVQLNKLNNLQSDYNNLKAEIEKIKKYQSYNR